MYRRQLLFKYLWSRPLIGIDLVVTRGSSLRLRVRLRVGRGVLDATLAAKALPRTIFLTPQSQTQSHAAYSDTTPARRMTQSLPTRFPSIFMTLMR